MIPAEDRKHMVRRRSAHAGGIYGPMSPAEVKESLGR
jgi:hypothetical protein